MIKVCHMTSAHSAEDERIFFKEALSLIDHQYDVYIVAKGESYKKGDVNIIGCGYPNGGRLSRMTSFARHVYETALALDADIYHFHDPELLPFGLKLKKRGKRVIFDSHENTVEQIMEKEWIPSFVRIPLYRCFDAYQKHVCRHLDAVVSVTPHICDYFRRFVPKVSMITNYPSFKEFPQTMQQRNRSLCFAGGISEQWCHREIITALPNVQDCTYVLCGDGNGDYFSNLKLLPGWNQVDFVGRIPHEKVHEVLYNCSVGLSLLKPGHNTGWHVGTMGNTKIFEEMMAGLPIICTDFDLWKEFVERYHCGICVDPTNVDEISNAIRYLLDNPEEAKHMGENGRRAIKEEFNWGVEEKKLLALYEDILKS